MVKGLSRGLIFFIIYPVAVFAQTPNPAPTLINPRSDVNRDNVVDELDMIILMQDWSKMTEPSPTPTNTPTVTPTPTNTSTPTPTATATPQIITVTGGVGLQAAIDSASPGATIRILDDLVYNEDIFISPGKDGLTIIGAGSDPPTILAANDSISTATSPNVDGRGLVGALAGLLSHILTAGTISLPDQMGMVVEAQGVTLKNLTIQNDGPSIGYDVLSSALTIIGDDCNVSNCQISGTDKDEPEAKNQECCLVLLSGGWSALDDALGLVGLADYFSNLGYSQTVPKNPTFDNCIFTRSTNGFLSVDYSQFLYNAITTEYLTSILPSGITFHGCEWIGVGDEELIQTGGVEDVSFRNNTFHFNEGTIRIGGGEWLFEDCVFSDSPDRRFILQDSALDVGGGAPQSRFLSCTFCGDSPGYDAQIRIHEGSASFDYCVFSASEDSILHWDYNNWDSEFPVFGYPEEDQVVEFNQCDLYKPHGPRPAVLLTGNDEPDSPQPGSRLVLQNSIVTSEIGVQITGSNLPPDGGEMTVRNNDFIGAIAVDDQLPWMESTMINNLFNVDPYYYDPEGCEPYSFEYYNSALYFSSTTGGPIGSTPPFLVTK